MRPIPSYKYTSQIFATFVENPSMYMQYFLLCTDAICKPALSRALIQLQLMPQAVVSYRWIMIVYCMWICVARMKTKAGDCMKISEAGLRSQKGIIFDIQRCSLFDGPGIRPTAFFKGCPLRCKWCHNPESQEFVREIYYNPEKCTSCMSCAAVCPKNCHVRDENGHYFNRENCIRCGACTAACPTGALQMKGYEINAAEVLDEVLKDRDYYESSGGGLTLSGGEPMAQFNFAKVLLMGAKSHGLHTCMETCGYAPQAHYQEILPLTDLFLFDYKATDPKLHRELTGASNDLIISSLAFLYSQKAGIVLRCPLIPGVNDSEEHLAGIAEISRRFPELRGIEIMAYHNLGTDKSLMLGRKPEYQNKPGADDIQKEKWLTMLKSMGCSKAVIG